MVTVVFGPDLRGLEFVFPHSVAKDLEFMTDVLLINQSNTEQIMAFSDINMSLISIKNFDIPRC